MVNLISNNLRDIAARNCLLKTTANGEKKMIVKVGDFGLSRRLYDTQYYKENGRKPLPVRCKHPNELDS